MHRLIITTRLAREHLQGNGRAMRFFEMYFVEVIGMSNGRRWIGLYARPMAAFEIRALKFCARSR